MRPLISTPAGLIALYLAVTFPLFLLGGVSGTEALVALAHTVALVAMLVLALNRELRLRAGWGALWLPAFVLMWLYPELPWLNQALGPGYFDERVLAWETAIFQVDLARELAGWMPWRWVSELFHLGYLSFYVLAILPALLLFMRGEEEACRTTFLALVLASVVSYSVFVMFPVQGPRYFGPPEGIPDGPLRHLTLVVLEANSSQGSAFPSGHVALMVCNAVLGQRFFPRLRWVLTLAALVVFVGVVYAGFHYAVDAVAGAALGGGAAVWALAVARAPDSAGAARPEVAATTS